MKSAEQKNVLALRKAMSNCFDVAKKMSIEDQIAFDRLWNWVETQYRKMNDDAHLRR